MNHKQKLSKPIHKYIIDTFGEGVTRINLKEYDTDFLMGEPYHIHKNMLEYICEQIALVDFSVYDNVCKQLHIEIFKHKGIRLKMVSGYIINKFPHIVDNTMFNYDDFVCLPNELYYLPPNRIPIMLKYFSGVEFSVIDDHQLFIKNKLDKMISVTKRIKGNIVNSFNPTDTNIIVTKKNIGFVTHFMAYGFPQGALGFLVKELNKINFLDCDDIHWTIHKKIGDIKKNIIAIDPICSDVSLREIYGTLSEVNKVRLLRKYDGQPLWLNNENIIVKNNCVYKFNCDDVEDIVFKEIIFDCRICMLCDKIKNVSNYKFYVTRGMLTCDEIPLLYFCSGFCNSIIASTQKVDKDKVFYGMARFDKSKIWNFRHFKIKYMMLKCNVDISNFGLLNVDTFGVIVNMFMDLVFNSQ